MTDPTNLRATNLAAAGGIAALTVTNAIVRVSLATLRSRRSVPWFSRSLACVAVGACLLAGLVASARPAQAAFPGANGKIAFASDREGAFRFQIFVMDADGSNQTRLTTDPDGGDAPDWSPEGMKVAFHSHRDGNGDIYTMNADGSNETRLTHHSAGDLRPVWSADRSKLAFSSWRDSSSEIYVMDADGSNQTPLTNHPALDMEPSWSPDGSRLAFTSWRDGNAEIYVMNADGSNQMRMTVNPADDVLPDWSPDGTKLAFTSNRAGNSEIYAMNADGSSQTRLTTNPSSDGQSVWSPDGSKLAFTSWRDGNSEIYAMSADGSNQTRLTNNPAIEADPVWQPVVSGDFTAPVLTLRGANPLTLEAGSPYVEPGATAVDDVDGDVSAAIVTTGAVDTLTPRIYRVTYTVADAAGNTTKATRAVLVVRTTMPKSNGQIAFTSARDGIGDIYTMNADGSNQTRLTSHPDFNGEPAWSPDGSTLAFAGVRDGFVRDIYVMNADGSNQTRLTNDQFYDAEPVWSPDGSRLALWSTRDGNFDIYVMNADGSNQTQLTNNPAFDWEPAWSPDGTRFAFTSGFFRTGGFVGGTEIYVMNADGSNQTRLTPDRFSDSGPAWSPDGSRLAFTSDRDGNLEIYVMNTDGTGQTRLTTDPGADWEPAWSPDGTKIAFTSGLSASAEIYVINADGSDRTRLTNNAAADNDPDWQPLALDRTPPVLTLPGNLAVDATGPAGALVNYSVVARDDRDSGPVVACTPPSGSTFAIGDTTVTCTATDASGNSSTATFTIHVRSATEQLLELQTLIEGYQLKRSLGSDLSRYLNRAVKYIGRGQAGHACQQLDQFLATVERTAAKTPPSLSSSQATTLTEGGRRIRAVVGC